MPIYDEPASATPPIVSPSAALELFWITFRCESRESPARRPIFAGAGRASARLAQRTQEFWAEGDEGFPEVIVIANRRGLLAGESLDEFLADLPLSALRTDDLALASETAETRDMIVGRLQRLAADRALRKRYLALLNDLWRSVRVDWETTGVPSVRRAAEAAQRRLAAGEKPADLAPKVSEPSLALLRHPGQAQVLVCPGYFAGRCVWELPGTLLLGFGTDAGSDLLMLRQRAEALAQRLKSLSDPTRLSILLRLAAAPASVTEVTREFAISQPAVSAHFRVLREAGLVLGDRHGTRTIYRLNAPRAAALVDDLADCLTLARPGKTG